MTQQNRAEDDLTAATTAMHHRYLRSLRPFRHNIMSSCDLSTTCYELSQSLYFIQMHCCVSSITSSVEMLVT